MKRSLPMHLFPFLMEVSLLNNRALFIEYPDSDYTSHDIMFEGSKNLPRKKKKKINSKKKKEIEKNSKD